MFPARMALISLLLVFGAPGMAEETTPAEAETPDPAEETMHFTSEHRVSIGGKSLAYTVTAGTLLMKNAEHEPIAQFGYTAYIRKGGNQVSRPLLFAYNGGPGSASMWLHMGILGPRRTQVQDLDFNTEGPFKHVDNEYSILDRADLVMIDPVGTGFSRAVGEAKGEDFWGVDQDITSVSNFIARYVSDNKRWSSPKYLLGESYGGVRSGGVAYELLKKHNLTLNGVILVSPYMDFVAGNAGLKIDLPYVNYFSTYAATAWYHGVSRYRPDDLEQFLTEAEAFATDLYAPLLLKGNRASEAERQKVLEGMARFTGIGEDYWDRANLRVAESRFAKEVLRSQRKTVGRIDSRFKGDSSNHIAESFSYDPFFPAIGPAFVATFNDYYRGELGVETDRRYITSGGLYRNWDQRHAQPGQSQYEKVPVTNTAVDLAHAMVQNPKMRLLVQQGYYDLATPYGATRYFLDHMDVPPNVANNITVEYYEAGHMMYLHEPSLVKFKQDLARFIGE